MQCIGGDWMRGVCFRLLLFSGCLTPAHATDVLVVGSGIAGLSATLEAARSGADVTLMEMRSVFGGTSIMSGGHVWIVNTPFQKERGVNDSSDLAYADLLAWGEDINREWARWYADHSAVEVYDFLFDLGIRFRGLAHIEGNSVPRGHTLPEHGMGLVNPVFQACAQLPNVRFLWNVKATGLVKEGNRITGVRGVELRTGEEKTYPAAVILATGGFQNNLDMVREHWSADLPLPDRILSGTGANSTGAGHVLAAAAGADFHRMSYMWNYPYGVPDPRTPDGSTGQYVRHNSGIWVNMQGLRFVNEQASPNVAVPALVRQSSARCWVIFDEAHKRDMFIPLAPFHGFRDVLKELLANPRLVLSAPDLRELATLTNLPVDAFVETVQHYNTMVERGEDTDFRRFTRETGNRPSVAAIATPPFYALQVFPLARKNMGGLRIDSSARVLDMQGRPIPGLYAAGELTGLAGINGKAALEGTFLGPSIATGRMAGRTAVSDLHLTARDAQPGIPATAASDTSVGESDCASCHPVADLVGQQRPGYTHFELSHRVVQDQSYPCENCHAGMQPYPSPAHVMDWVHMSNQCAKCHTAQKK